MKARKANYCVSGTQSDRAFQESKVFQHLETYNSNETVENALKYSNLSNNINISSLDDYLYICSNETINGTQFRQDGYPFPSRKQLGETKLIIDMIDIVLKNYLENGGLSAATSKSKALALKVYNYLDTSDIFSACIKDAKSRSYVNIPFYVDDVSTFLDYCYRHNVVGLRVKTPFCYSQYDMKEPLRISLYNGISETDVDYLIDIMSTFELITCV